MEFTTRKWSGPFLSESRKIQCYNQWNHHPNSTHPFARTKFDPKPSCCLSSCEKALKCDHRACAYYEASWNSPAKWGIWFNRCVWRSVAGWATKEQHLKLTVVQFGSFIQSAVNQLNDGQCGLNEIKHHFFSAILEINKRSILIYARKAWVTQSCTVEGRDFDSVTLPFSTSSLYGSRGAVLPLHSHIVVTAGQEIWGFRHRVTLLLQLERVTFRQRNQIDWLQPYLDRQKTNLQCLYMSPSMDNEWESHKTSSAML